MTTIDKDQVAALAYEGAMEPAPFGQFLEALRDWLEADASTILIERRSRQFPAIILSCGGTPSGLERYREAFFRDDPFVDLEPGRLCTLHEHLGAEGVQRSSFFADYLEPFGLTFVLGADLVVEGGTRVRIRASRRAGGIDFGEAEKVRLAALSPDLKRALSLFLRLTHAEVERDLYAGVLTRMAVGMVVVDRTGRILDINPAARAILAKGDPLTDRGGTLRLAEAAAEARALAELIAVNADAALSGSEPPAAQALRVASDDGGVGLIVRPAPTPAKLDGALVGAAVVVITDGDRDVAPQPKVLTQLFGLTAAEAELGVLLAQGRDLDEASQALGVAKNTARAQLRAIFAKTGVTRQSGLVRLLLRSVDEFV